MNRNDLLDIFASIVFLTLTFALYYFAMWVFYYNKKRLTST